MSAPTDFQVLELHHGELTCRLEFVRKQDRWSHRFELTRNSQTVASLTSIEGSAEDNWPVSPPFQELSIETRGDQNVGLLVGMSGKSHWSASVTAVEAAECAGWELDVACLAKQPPELLGSRYRKLQHCEDVRVRAIKGCQYLEAGENELQLTPEFTNIKIPQTICWKYQIVTILR